MPGLMIRRAFDLALEASEVCPTCMNHENFVAFARAYVRRIDDALLQGRGSAALIALIRSHAEFLTSRAPDEILVRVFNPNLEADGYVIDATVVETVMADQAFILDTLKLLLRSHDHAELECLHPVMEIHRDSKGRLQRVGTREGAHVLSKESLIHIEIERVDEVEIREKLRSTLRERLLLAQAMVRDFRPMMLQVEAAERALREISLPHLSLEAKDAADFVAWLAGDHFVFRAYGEFDVSFTPEGVSLTPRAAAALGLGRSLGLPDTGLHFPEVARPFLSSRPLLFFGKDEIESTVHRSGRVDTVIIKELDSNGEITGVRLFNGLLTFKGVRHEGSTIPILRRRLERMRKMDELEPGSYLYKASEKWFNALPVEYLFSASDEALKDALELIERTERGEGTEIDVRVDSSQRFAFVLIGLPADHYNEALRERMTETLSKRLGATYHAHRLVVGESGHIVLHLYLTAPEGLLHVDTEALEAEVRAIAKPWHDQLEEALSTLQGEDEAERLLEIYQDAFPSHYTVSTSPAEAAQDVCQLEEVFLHGQLKVRISRAQEDPGSHGFRISIYQKRRMILTDTLPVLHNFGLSVVDQFSTLVTTDNGTAYVDVYRINGIRGLARLPPPQQDANLTQGLILTLTEEMDNDPLNALVLSAQLSARQVNVLRAYMSFGRQVANVPLFFLQQVWDRHPRAARKLIDLFETKFDPSLEPGRDGPQRQLLLKRRREAVFDYLRSVDNASEDRVLRLTLRLIEATLRTNVFRTTHTSLVAIKLDRELARPGETGLRPLVEFFVYHPEGEGILMRGEPIARGGVRWSDRTDDYHTEILGLTLTQMVKNVLIVPGGANGGFVLRRRSLTLEAERLTAERMYGRFVRGLLELSDNRIEGRIEPPPGVLCLDGPDWYLVTAPDKGTSHLSDAVNTIALEHNFWLSDAFSSGGSTGYDLKREAITSRGVWECVKRHFREMGRDPEHEEVIVVGIGDMSGDVFGNGMLASRSLKLLAAFNHQHIFLDPNPDPSRSYDERLRLFHLPGSTWEDYSVEVLSRGGGVYRRAARSIVLSREAQEMLGVSDTALSGEELIRRVLMLPADLLWIGGVGTYVKASMELNTEVGDVAHEPVRVDAANLRFRVIAEGGNLGLTQAARVEAARQGIRLNSDAVDNSAAVDISDHEVNLKILLEPVCRAGRLSQEERRDIMSQVKYEVVEGVLSHNYSQSLLISLDIVRSQADLSRFMSLIENLEAEADLIRPRERIPTDQSLLERASRQEGLLRPELARLLGYEKMRVKRRLAADDRMRDPAFESQLFSYFPSLFQKRFRAEVLAHPLRQQIVATVLTNKIIDRAGVTFFTAMQDDTGATPTEIAAAWMLCDGLLEVGMLRQSVLEMDRSIRLPEHCRDQYQTLIWLEDQVASHACLMLSRSEEVLNRLADLEKLREDYRLIRLELRQLFPARVHDDIYRSFADWLNRGLPHEVARQLAELPYVLEGADISRLREGTGLTLSEAALLHHQVGEACGVSEALELTTRQESGSRWERSALAVLRSRFRDLRFQLASQAARSLSSSVPIPERLEKFLTSRTQALERVRQFLSRLRRSKAQGVAPLTILAQFVTELARHEGPPSE